MAVFTNKSRDEIDFTDSTAPVINDYPRPYIDQKTTTLDGAIRKIVEEFYKKDIVSGITEFPAQILRVEQRRDRFEPSYLDNLGRDINRELSRRYKVKVVLVDDLKETPKTFDETPEDRELIDTYPDFIYIPYSFGNNEPMNVGDFVMITYGNLLSRQDGRIIYKISGASHVQGSVGRPAKQEVLKKDKQEAKKIFKEQPPPKSSAPVAPVEVPPEVKTQPPPPPPSPPPAQPTDDLKRTLIDTGFISSLQQKINERRSENETDLKYNAEIYPLELEEYNKKKKEIEEFNIGKPKSQQKKLPIKPQLRKIKEPIKSNLDKVSFEEFRERWYNTFKRGTINLYKYNKDRTQRPDPSLKEILIDFKKPENKIYKRSVFPNDSDGYKDSIYIRAFLDVIAIHEASVNFGWNLLFIGKDRAHPEDVKINEFYDFSQHPSRPSFSDNNNFGETASSAAGRYQFTYSTWKGFSEKIIIENQQIINSIAEENKKILERNKNKPRSQQQQKKEVPKPIKKTIINPEFPDFTPRTQDKAAAKKLIDRLARAKNTKEEFANQNLGEILKNAINSGDIAVFERLFASSTDLFNTKETSCLGKEWTSLPKKVEAGTAGSQEITKIEYRRKKNEKIPFGKKFAYLPEIFMIILKLMQEDQQRIQNGEETIWNEKGELWSAAIEQYTANEEARQKAIQATKTSTEESQPPAAKKAEEEKQKGRGKLN